MARRDPLAVGVDVGSTTFHLAIHGETEIREFDNTEDGRKTLLRFLKKRKRSIRVVLESTGAYGLQLALLLAQAKRVDVFYVNPMAAKAYVGRGILPRAKCDRVDALALARMAADDIGAPWEPPAQHLMDLRTMVRRIRTLINDQTREKNRLKAGKSAGIPQTVIQDIEDNIEALARRIDRLRRAAVEFARGFDGLSEDIELLDTIIGVGPNTAVEVLAELKCMPSDLTAKQLVAQAGLDPRAVQSGRRDGPRRISKMGSKYLRATLHMAAHNAVRFCPEVAEFYRVLTEDRGKHRLTALVAVARKLLHCMHGMLLNRTAFVPSRFYNPRVSG